MMVQFEWLGEGVDQETDSQQVDADLYDNGVEAGELLTCQKTHVQVKVSVADREDPQHPYDGEHLLYLNALVDWNGDGSWGGQVSCPDGAVVQEWAVRNLGIDVSSWPQGTTSAVVPLELVAGPEASQTWARFTLSYAQVISGDDWDGRGSLSFGETEDYVLIIGGLGDTSTHTASATSEPTVAGTSTPVSEASLAAGVGVPLSLLCPGAGLALCGAIGALWIARRRSRVG